ncbi:SWIM zinc finger family protein [Haladaptatus salinisoli]|uniref:SWIM zinc finger family protein n=1 Tax=Haladaptatus salinisoli TaxID=2884876 RepID=UPI001D0B19E3|nr:SWIM zinc finger family protein [Haladaptatus salinisoli]
MSTKSPSELEADETAQKRAQWEHFSFDVDAPGLIDVTNESHENPEEHQYVVSIDDVTHELMACTCPHHIHRNAYCKHMAAVETATDDGTLEAFPSEDDETDEDDAEPAECDCDGLGGFPCWPCVRTGQKELPN